MSIYTSYSGSDSGKQKSDFSKKNETPGNPDTPKASSMSKSVYDVNPNKSVGSTVLNLFIIFDLEHDTAEVSILDCNKLSVVKKRRIDYSKSLDKFITDLKLFIANSIENLLYKF